jgi:hypothetical protein
LFLHLRHPPEATGGNLTDRGDGIGVDDPMVKPLVVGLSCSAAVALLAGCGGISCTDI